MNSKNNILEIKDLCFAYGKNQSMILDNLSFNFEKKKIYCILGENGSGKSTLLNCINNININYSGSIKINVEDNFLDVSNIKDNERSKLISYVAQHNHQSSLSVYDYIMLGRKPYINFSPLMIDHEIVSNTISKFKINNISTKNCNEISGGEFKKVCIARAFAQKSPLLIMDEPTNNLDVYNQHEIFTKIQETVKTKNLSVICVVHDVNLAIKYADELLFMKNGKIAKNGKKDIVTKDLLHEIYGVNSHIFEENEEKFIVI